MKVDEETSGIIGMKRLIDKVVNASRWLGEVGPERDTDVLSGEKWRNQNPIGFVKFLKYVDIWSTEAFTPVTGPTFCPHELSETCLFITAACLGWKKSLPLVHHYHFCFFYSPEKLSKPVARLYLQTVITFTNVKTDFLHPRKWWYGSW